MGRASVEAFFKKPVSHEGKTKKKKKKLPDIILPVLEHYLINAKGVILGPPDYMATV